MEQLTRTCKLHGQEVLSFRNRIENDCSYVINARAQRQMYKSMPRNQNPLKEPKDLSKEWHNDGT
jgi:hypothetical protein